MRTNIDLDDDLVARAMEITGLPTKRAVVHEALETLIRVRARRSLLELRGSVTFADGYDHKALREERS